jgi:NitT/TauT family transport system substrate-binding protein
VWSAYSDGFVITAQQAGYTLNLIYPDDYGVHFYADCLFTTDDVITNNPQLVRRFLRATLKGWTYAVEHPTAIGPLVVKYKPDADAALEIAKMTTALPLVNTGEDHIGWMRPEMWSGMEKTLRDQGVLTTPVDVAEVYTLQFLREIYGNNQ